MTLTKRISFLALSLVLAYPHAAPGQSRTDEQPPVVTGFTFGYSNFRRDAHRVDFSWIYVSSSRRLMIEMPILPIVFSVRDTHGNGGAVSASPVLSVPLAVSAFNRFDREDAHPVGPALVLGSILNARYHFLLTAEVDRRGTFDVIRNGLSVFLKTQTDYFLGKHPWFNISPGVGIGIWIREVHLELGYNRNIEGRNTSQRSWMYATIGVPFMFE